MILLNNNCKQPALQSFIPKTLAGADSFQELVDQSTVIIDKTLFIKDFLLSSDKVTLLAYPRRWGKTINMSMLKTFLELEIDFEGNELPTKTKRNFKLFNNTNKNKIQPSFKIWHEQAIVTEYFGKAPVIYLSFKDIRGENYDQIRSRLANKISALYANHTYLLKSKKLEQHDISKIKNYIKGKLDLNLLMDCLLNLSQYLAKHFNKKIFILIDEYDSAINYANLHFESENERFKTLELFRNILSCALKENLYLHKALVTGIMRIAKADLFSGVNNFIEHGILSREYSEYYGFTQQEVEQLFLAYQVPEELGLQIKNWYNGYNFSGTAIYNPWSIIQCLSALHRNRPALEQKHQGNTDLNYLWLIEDQNILRSYWEESGNVDFLHDLLRYPQLQTKFSDLLNGEAICFNLRTLISFRDFKILRKLTVTSEHIDLRAPAIDLLFSYLFLSGYLTSVPNSKTFCLPNKEIRHELANKLLIYYEELYNIDPILFQQVTEQLQLLLSNQICNQLGNIIKKLTECLQNLLNKFPKFDQIKEHALLEKSNTDNDKVPHGNEDLMHSILTYIVLQVRNISILATEMYLGKGRADLVLINGINRKAVIIELKYNRSAEEALAQIKLQEYAKKLQTQLTCYLIGININTAKNIEIKTNF